MVQITLSALAERFSGKVVGPPDHVVVGVSPLESPGEGRLCVVWERPLLEQMAPTVPLVAPLGWLDGERFGVEVDDPKRLFPEILALFHEEERFRPGVDATAVVASDAHVDNRAHVGPLCVVESGAVIEEGAVLEALVYVGRDAVVGRGSHVEPQVCLYRGTVVGENVLIHGGTVIGSDGFGFILDFDEGHRKIPQTGAVRIGKDVEIGACVTIDRGTVGDTVIGEGTKTDDHVHVGHNAKIGPHCILVAQTGISGSAILEEGVIMAARSGVKDHVRIGRGAQIAALGGAVKDVAPGAVVSGFPARDHREVLRTGAALARLPELLRTVRHLEARLETLERRSSE